MTLCVCSTYNKVDLADKNCDLIYDIASMQKSREKVKNRKHNNNMENNLRVFEACTYYTFHIKIDLMYLLYMYFFKL